MFYKQLFTGLNVEVAMHRTIKGNVCKNVEVDTKVLKRLCAKIDKTNKGGDVCQNVKVAKEVWKGMKGNAYENVEMKSFILKFKHFDTLICVLI